MGLLQQKVRPVDCSQEAGGLSRTRYDKISSCAGLAQGCSAAKAIEKLALNSEIGLAPTFQTSTTASQPSGLTVYGSYCVVKLKKARP